VVEIPLNTGVAVAERACYRTGLDSIVTSGSSQPTHLQNPTGQIPWSSTLVIKEFSKWSRITSR